MTTEKKAKLVARIEALEKQMVKIVRIGRSHDTAEHRVVDMRCVAISCSIDEAKYPEET